MTKHLEAVETALSAAAGRLTEADAPLIELCRALARQVDDAGPNASTRLTASYLSCLKDLRRVLSANSTPTPVGGKLAQLRANVARQAR